MLLERPFWKKLIEDTWREKSIIWLMGVRQVGKTSLCKSIEDIEYFDCELPRTRELLQDPEEFLTSKKGKRIVLDEIHRLENPSEILKIAADHYPSIKIIATGSSTLGTSAKFRDTLTGRKRSIWLTPLLLHEMNIFGDEDLRHRFLFGGCPAFFESQQFPEKSFQEWFDSYWAKDIQDMFTVGKRDSFFKFAELLLSYSGGQFEASKFTVPCEVSRATIMNYLAVLNETFIVNILRPYSTHKATEIVMVPKVYGFDTGFVCYSKGWHSLRKEDLGVLWEHCVLNEILGTLQMRSLHYWRSKNGHEVDFVIPDKTDRTVTAIECKFKSATSDVVASVGKNIEVFRQHYPEGKNFVVASDVGEAFERSYNTIRITFVNPDSLVKHLQKSSSL